MAGTHDTGPHVQMLAWVPAFAGMTPRLRRSSQKSCAPIQALSKQREPASNRMYKPFDLTGKVALVTGGNSGIGLGMARALAEAGADVAIWGTNATKNAAAQAELAESGRKVLALVVRRVRRGGGGGGVRRDRSRCSAGSTAALPTPG